LEKQSAHTKQPDDNYEANKEEQMWCPACSSMLKELEQGKGGSETELIQDICIWDQNIHSGFESLCRI
jgi:hypothetical protein